MHTSKAHWYLELYSKCTTATDRIAAHWDFLSALFSVFALENNNISLLLKPCLGTGIYPQSYKQLQLRLSVNIRGWFHHSLLLTSKILILKAWRSSSFPAPSLLLFLCYPKDNRCSQTGSYLAASSGDNVGTGDWETRRLKKSYVLVNVKCDR